MKTTASILSCVFGLALVGPAAAQTGVFRKDDTSNAPWQTLMTGTTNQNLQLIAGVNTSAAPFGSLQAFWQATGPLPLVLQGSGGNVGIGTNNPASRLHILDATGGGSGLLLQAGYPYGAGVYPSVLKIKDKDNAFDLFDIRSNGAFYFNRGPDRVLTGAADGNVGIGVQAPAARLDIRGRNSQNSYSVDCAIAEDLRVLSSDNRVNDGGVITIGGLWGPTGYIKSAAHDGTAGAIIIGNRRKVSDTTMQPGIVLMPSGNVGIGTTSPGTKLQVLGDVSLGYWNNAVSRFVGTTQSDNNFAGAGSSVEFTSEVDGGGRSNAINFRTHHYGVSAGIRMTVNQDGDVGIGTTNPTNKLEVNGTIRTKEVIVETTGWSDYVFAPDYRLAPLSEVEAHIQAKGTLPGIPSAAEVAEHGVSVGDMQAKLLAKVEELTLHLIELKKENAELRQEVRALAAAQIR